MTTEPSTTGAEFDEYEPMPTALTAATLNTKVPLLSEEIVAAFAVDVGSLNTVQLDPLSDEYEIT